MRYKKYYTQKEWSKFKTFHKKEINGKTYYIDVQEVMCKKYDIILTDYLTRNEKIVQVLKKFNKKNFDKGMLTFNQSVQAFTGSIDALTKEIGHAPEKKHKQNKVKIWSESKTNGPKVKLWSDKPKAKRPKKKSKKLSKDQQNIVKLWGKK